jgi:[histone H3]-lysine36 N-trimethyltransferase
MECGGDCTCGADCQNQRFTRRLYADVSVILTEKKGYGLRANTDLRPNDFIFEYIGEVIAENAFRKRMVAYDQEGIKHFYFMSLSRGEFIDATKRGNLGRFCNHSCNPNCYVDKWVVGDKLRMGIFAEKSIKAGEELVFNYNVDRYGANPQPCYCGEDNCTGFIGGKTQTERGTKLSAATIEALGIEDDEWDTVVAKKPKKKKTAEDDEDYVESVPLRALDADSVTKVMAALMQCKEKWIAVKLLQRIHNADDELVRHRIVRLHGYRILNSQLSAWKDDENIIIQILDILDQLPRMTRNKIVDARLDQTLETLSNHEDARVAARAAELSATYSKLELAYRIPRRKQDKDDATPVKIESSVYNRRETLQRRRSRSRSKSPPKGPASMNAPTGPRLTQRGGFAPRPFPRPPPPAPLPRGWHAAVNNGRTYYYTDKGVTQWTRPTQPAEVTTGPTPTREPSHQDVLKGILDGMTKSKKEDTSTPEEPPKKGKKEEKWKSYDEEKKMKLYENTVSFAEIVGMLRELTSTAFPSYLVRHEQIQAQDPT